MPSVRLDGHDINGIVVCMCAYEANVNNSIWVIDLHDQSVLIARNVKCHPVSRQHASRSEMRFQGRGRSPVGVSYFLMPGFQRALGLWISFPEGPQSSFGNNAHRANLA